LPTRLGRSRRRLPPDDDGLPLFRDKLHRVAGDEVCARHEIRALLLVDYRLVGGGIHEALGPLVQTREIDFETNVAAVARNDRAPDRGTPARDIAAGRSGSDPESFRCEKRIASYPKPVGVRPVWSEERDDHDVVSIATSSPVLSRPHLT
jgi:hypothetical protein